MSSGSKDREERPETAQDFFRRCRRSDVAVPAQLPEINEIRQIYETIKEHLCHLHPDDQMRSLSKSFNDAVKWELRHGSSDSGGSAQISPNSIGLAGFQRILRKFGVKMNEMQFRTLFKKFDLTGHSCLNFDNFVSGITRSKQGIRSDRSFVPSSEKRPQWPHQDSDLPSSLSKCSWTLDKLRRRLSEKLGQHAVSRVEQYRKMFAFCSDKGGRPEELRVDKSRMRSAMNKFGIIVSKEDIKSVFREISKDRDNVSVHDFIARVMPPDYFSMNVLHPPSGIVHRNLSESSQSVLHDPNAELAKGVTCNEPSVLHALGLTPSDLVRLLRAKVEARSTRSDADHALLLWKVFQAFDEDGDFVQTKDELKKMLMYFNFTVHDTDFDVFFEFVADPADEKVHWEDFCAKVYPPNDITFQGRPGEPAFFSRNFNHADNTYLDDFSRNVHDVRDEPDRDLMLPPIFTPLPEKERRKRARGKAVFTPRFRPTSSASSREGVSSKAKDVSSNIGKRSSSANNPSSMRTPRPAGGLLEPIKEGSTLKAKKTTDVSPAGARRSKRLKKHAHDTGSGGHSQSDSHSGHSGQTETQSEYQHQIRIPPPILSKVDSKECRLPDTSKMMLPKSH
eukprot:1003868_1